MKRIRMKNTAHKERFVLLIYGAYSIGLAAISYLQDWNALIAPAVVAGLLASVLFYLKEYRTYKFRASFTSCMIWMNFILYACHSQDIFGTLSSICAGAVLTGVYFLRRLTWIGLFSFIFILIWHMPYLAELFAGKPAALNLQSALQIAAIFLTMYTVNYFVKQQEASNEELLITIRDLKAAQQSKSDFMSNMSHELRTPINTICGISEMVMRDSVLSDRTRRDILDIQTAGRNLLSIISDILDYSELEDGKMELAEETYNISSTINDVLNIAISKNTDKNLEIIVDCDPNIPSGLIGDEQKLRRVIMNIVDNAIKFTNSGGILIRVSSREEEYGVNLIVSVSDTGVGIEADEIDGIFSSFRQIDADRNRRQGGIGLGLAISQVIIDKMGGFITVKSTPGKGTKVQFVVPQKVADEKPIITVSNPEELRVLGYTNMEKYDYTLLRDGYATTIKNLVNGLGFSFVQCRNLAELKRRVEKELFTHIFVSYEEYSEDPAYFEELSQTRTVIVVLDREDSINGEPGGDIVPLYKPFYALPVASVLNGELEITSGAAPAARKFKAPDVRVLVVDDSIMNLRVAEGLLRPYQMQVFMAESGREALEKLDNTRFDFILMDHMMPDMDGVETLRRIRQKPGQYYKTLPVIALTANAIGGAREMFLSEGFADFIPKPVEISVLERALLRNIPKEKIIYEEKKKPAQNITIGAAKSAAPKPKTAPKANTKEALTLKDIDIKTGIGFCGGNKEDYMDVLKIYYKDGAKKIAALKDAYAKKDWKTYTIHAHSVKSMSMGIGALPLSNMAKDLEAAAREANENFIAAHNKDMLNEYGRILDIIGSSSALFPEGAVEAPKKAEQPQGGFLADVNLLIEKLDAFEPAPVDEAISRLLASEGENAEIVSLLNQIKEKAASFDFTGAAEIAGRLKEINPAVGESGTVAKDISKEELLAGFNALLEKLEAFESAGVDEAIKSVGAYSYGGKTVAAMLNGVKEKAGSFDFIGAAEELRELTGSLE